VPFSTASDISVNAVRNRRGRKALVMRVDLVTIILLYRGGRAIAKAVSSWIPTAAVRVCTQADHVGFMVENLVLGQVFFEYFSSHVYHRSKKFSVFIIIRANWWPTC
jgi:hypothetical protein